MNAEASNEVSQEEFERVLTRMLRGPEPSFVCYECGEEVEPETIARRIRVFCAEHVPEHDETWKSQPYN